MFTLSWMPNPEVSRDAIDVLGTFDDVALAFREIPRLIGAIPAKNLNWTFDGDGWTSEGTVFDILGFTKWEYGQFYITWE